MPVRGSLSVLDVSESHLFFITALVERDEALLPVIDNKAEVERNEFIFLEVTWVSHRATIKYW